MDLTEVLALLTDQELTEIADRARVASDTAGNRAWHLVYRSIELAARQALLGR